MTLEIPQGELHPILPLRDIVVFPHMVVPLFVGRDKSVKALESLLREDQEILLLTQKDSSLEDPKVRDFYSVGTFGKILQLLKLPDGTVKVLVEGRSRASILRFSKETSFFQAYANPLEEIEGDSMETEALIRTATSLFEQYLKLNSKIPPDILASISKINSPCKLADTLASHLSLKIEDKQELLEIADVNKRVERICSHMEGEISVLQTEKRIRGRVKRQMEKSQRDYYLNEQMKAIQKELGDSEDGQDELTEFETRLAKTKLSEEARDKATAELKN